MAGKNAAFVVESHF